jgi:hypothetical protein
MQQCSHFQVIEARQEKPLQNLYISARNFSASVQGCLETNHAQQAFDNTDNEYAAGKLMASLHECEQLVGSLLPDKPGQMRVFAFDGSDFTAGQVRWMKGQLRLIARDCADGDAVDASRRLAEVRQLLDQHRHEV